MWEKKIEIRVIFFFQKKTGMNEWKIFFEEDRNEEDR